MATRRPIELTPDERQKAQEYRELLELLERGNRSRPSTTKPTGPFASFPPTGKLEGAIISGELWRVKLALNEGANPNESNAMSGTALHMAASQGDLDAVKLLVNQGADYWLRDRYGRTPGEVAEERQQTAVHEYLGGLSDGFLWWAKALYPFTYLVAGFLFPLPYGFVILWVGDMNFFLFQLAFGHAVMRLVMSDRTSFGSRSRFVGAVLAMYAGCLSALGLFCLILGGLFQIAIGPQSIDGLAEIVLLVVISAALTGLGCLQYRLTPGDSTQDPKF